MTAAAVGTASFRYNHCGIADLVLISCFCRLRFAYYVFGPIGAATGMYSLYACKKTGTGLGSRPSGKATTRSPTRLNVRSTVAFPTARRLIVS